MDLVKSLEKRGSKFKQSEKLYKELISTISHQLKTPLAVTKWTTEKLLQEEIESSELLKLHKKDIETIEMTNRTMIALIDELLESSRAKTGGRKTKLENINFIELINNIIQQAKILAAKKKQSIELKYSGERLMLVTSKEVLEKIINNLITNALQYSPEHGTVLIEMEHQKDLVTISVSDKGIGIPAKEQEHIFKKFYRASNAQRIYPQGTGLGLYLIKKLAQNINAKIWFESKENKGSTFFVQLKSLK